MSKFNDYLEAAKKKKDSPFDLRESDKAFSKLGKKKKKKKEEDDGDSNEGVGEE